MLVPTTRMWWLLAGGIPIAAIGAQTGAPSLGLIYNVVLGCTALVSATVTSGRKALKVTRTFDTVLSVRVPNKIKLKIENLSSEPVSFRFRDEPPPTYDCSAHEFSLSLRPASVSERTYTVTPTQRGSDYFRGSVVRMNCPLGLVVRQERLPTNQPLRVYPNVLALREFSLLQQQGRLRSIGIRRSRIRGLGTEFESLREYGQGDDYRKIDWNATARRGKFIVRQDEAERNQSVVICIDAGRHMLGEVNGVTKLDYALDACLMLAQAAIFAGDQVGLLIYADHVVRYIPPKRGKLQLGLLIDAMHDSVVLPVASDATSAFAYLASRWKRRSLLIAFSDSGDKASAQDLLTALGPLIRRHVVFRPQISDPRLRETLTNVLDSAENLYLRGAGLFLDEDRRKASALFTGSGVITIESEPQDLAASLISYYYDAKEQARI